MLITILLFIAGIALILFGADRLVEGASGIARKFGLSEFLIGVTIVGIGTSMPELVVSLIAAIMGNPDITVGNITGSNIFNSMLILGVTALILPISFTSTNIKRDIPISLVAALLLFLFGMDKIIEGGLNTTNIINRTEGIILLLCFVAFMFISFKYDKADDAIEATPEAKPSANNQKVWLNVLYIVGGLFGLIFGGRIFVNSAIDIAKWLGVSESVIAITIMAGGTSLPELATCIVAAIKKRGQMAFGNILGSNISNIFLIVGSSAVITPLTLSPTTSTSLIVCFISSILIFVSAFTLKKKVLDRWEGAFFLLLYIAYIVYIVNHG